MRIPNSRAATKYKASPLSRPSATARSYANSSASLPPAAVAQFLDELTGPSATERLINELSASGELPEVVDALEHGENERALQLLLEAINATNGEEREQLIMLTVGLFGDLGDEHPLTMRYRRQLAASLY